MSQKKCKCPHCGKVNIFNEPSFEEAIEENLPAALLKAAGVTLIAALTGGLGALIAGGAVYGQSVARYVNGTSITCGDCGREFKV